jgi:hypothetical protein
MFKKENGNCLFNSCLSPKRDEKELLVTSPDDLTALKHKKEIKVSLKQKNRHSISSNLSIREHLTSGKNNESKSVQLYLSNKENKFVGTNLSFTSPYEKEINDNLPLNGKLSKTTLKRHSKNQAFPFDNKEKK